MQKSTWQAVAENPWMPFWLVLAGFSALVLPTLGLNRLMDWDELAYATVALQAARDGHWMPLNYLPWLQKPPLLPWLTALCIQAFGQGEASVRLPTFAFSALALGLAGKSAAKVAGRALAGLLAAGLLFCQTDYLFHSRFINTDTALLAGGMLALSLMMDAMDGPDALAPRRALMAGLALAFAAACKCWFVLAFIPGFLVFMAEPPQGLSRAGLLWRLALPPALVLLAWVAAYSWAYGMGFLAGEWAFNTWGRAVSGAPIIAGIGNLEYYSHFEMQMAPGALLLALPAALRLLLLLPSLRVPSRRTGLAFVILMMLAWGAGALVRHQVINYMLGFNLFACMAGALWLAWEESAWGLAGLGLLAGAALLLAQGPQALCWRWLSADHMLELALGLAAGLAWLAGRKPERALPARVLRGIKAGLLLLWLAALLPAAWQALWHPPNPNRPIVGLLLAHPASEPGQELALGGRVTQAPAYYSRYAARLLPPPPAPMPACAAIWFDGQVWRFKPAGRH